MRELDDVNTVDMEYHHRKSVKSKRTSSKSVSKKQNSYKSVRDESSQHQSRGTMKAHPDTKTAGSNDYKKYSTVQYTDLNTSAPIVIKVARSPTTRDGSLPPKKKKFKHASTKKYT